MPFGLGWSEVLLLLAVGLVLFGNKLPQLARSLGRTVTEFRRTAQEVEDEVAQATR